MPTAWTACADNFGSARVRSSETCMMRRMIEHERIYMRKLSVHSFWCIQRGARLKYSFSARSITWCTRFAPSAKHCMKAFQTTNRSHYSIGNHCILLPYDCTSRRACARALLSNIVDSEFRSVRIVSKWYAKVLPYACNLLISLIIEHLWWIKADFIEISTLSVMTFYYCWMLWSNLRPLPITLTLNNCIACSLLESSYYPEPTNKTSWSRYE